MANAVIAFTTGSTQLPDIGRLVYNGCTFSSLFYSSISLTTVSDEANRTIKYSEITLTVDGYVTLRDVGPPLAIVEEDINPIMTQLHQLLTAQGGALAYVGRGFDIVINQPGAGGGGGAVLRPGLPRGGAVLNNVIAGQNQPADLVWGPVPKLIDYQPLGAGLSAHVKWAVVIRISPIKKGAGFKGVNGSSPLLQFNYETSVSFGEDGFSRLSVRGVLEIPMTRQPNQASRTVPATADDFRGVVERRVLSNIDLSRFRITSREFPLSRDKRTLTFDVTAEEKPFMDLPPNCTVARGTFDVRPARTGPGLALWLCSLRATYTLRNDVPRRQAYLLFLALVRHRMAQSKLFKPPTIKEKKAEGGGLLKGIGDFFLNPFGVQRLNPALGVIDLFRPTGSKKQAEDVTKPIIIDFSMSEGLYLDSKTVSFSCTWRICVRFEHILVASGLWAKLPEVDAQGRNLWATSIQAVSGEKSWITNRVDPTLDVIVDFGSTE